MDWKSSFLDTPMDSSSSLKLALDIGRGMAYLHGITNAFRPQFILNSYHVMVRAERSPHHPRKALHNGLFSFIRCMYLLSASLGNRRIHCSTESG